MSDSRTAKRQDEAAGAVLVAFSAFLGWSTFDAFFFVARGMGPQTLALAPWALGGAAVFAFFAALARRGIVLVGALALLVALSVLPKTLGWQLSQAHAWLPRSLLLLVVAWLVARRWASFAHTVGPLQAGLACGLFAAAAKTAYRQGWLPDVYLLGGAVLAWAASRALSRPSLRLAASAILCGAPLALLGYKAFGREQLERSDLGKPSVAAQADKNLILIVLDTVRADDLGCYGAEADTTPHLDAFAREHAIRYTQARSTSPFTLPSHASLLTGLAPAEHQAARPGLSAQPIREDCPTLAEELRERGFQTAAIAANHAYLTPLYGFERGFEHFDARPGGGAGRYLALAQMYGASQRLGHLYYRDAAEITDTAIAWFSEKRREDEPFFLFLNYLDPHTPYLPPRQHQDAVGEGQPLDPLHPEEELWPLLHRRELRYTDEEVGRLLHWLEENGQFEDSAVIVTSDHGESLGEHGIPWHNWHLYDSLIHVPLLVKSVGPRSTTTNTEPISGADVFALALGEVGIEVERTEKPVLAEWYPSLPVSPAQKRWGERVGIDPEAHRITWLEDGHKIIVSSNGEVLAFDLALDPKEHRPLPLTPEETAAALDRATAWWAQHPLGESRAPELDAERLDNLRALGYGG